MSTAGDLLCVPTTTRLLLPNVSRPMSGRRCPWWTITGSKGRLVEIDGEQPVEEVAAQASRAIENGDRL